MTDRKSASCWTLLALLTLGLLLVGRAYHIADKRPPTFDDAWFLETSLHFYHRLTEGGLADFVAAYAGSFRTKAPLISVLPLPFYLALGARQQSAIVVNFVFLIVANVYLFLVVRRLFSPGAGLAAVIFFQTMPLAYGVSRVFMPDYGLTALVVVWIYYLVASDRLTYGPANLGLGIVLGLGLLMKVLFPLYVAGPFLVTLLRRRGAVTAKQQPFSSRHPLATIAIPALLIASTWYSFHLPTIIGYAWQAGYGDIGEKYGGASLAHWLYLVVNQGISFYYSIGVVVFGLAALATNRMRMPRSERTWLLLSWFAIPTAALAAGRNQEIRFILPVLPVLAIALAVWIFEVGKRPAVQAILVVLVALFPLRLYAALSVRNPHEGHDHPLVLGNFVLVSRDLGWARPPDSRGHWDQQRVLEALQHLGPPSLRRRYVVVGVEHPFFNPNLLQYFNAYTQYPFNFNSLGYAETSVERAVERIYSLDTRYIVMAEGFHSHELVGTFNRVNDDIQALLDRGELPFRLRAKVTLSYAIKAVIYEREAPWTRYEPGQKAPAPAHPLTVDFTGGLRLLGYDWTRKNRYLWEFSAYWTVPHRVFEDYRVNLELQHGGNILLAQDHFISGGQHPPYEWVPGEAVRQSLTVYLTDSRPVEGRLWLTSWGIGDPTQITFPKEMVHTSTVPLKLQ